MGSEMCIRDRSMKKYLPWLLLLASPVVLWKGCEAYDASRFAGVGQVAPDEPVQSPTRVAAFLHQGLEVIPLAEFSATARVLSARDYSDDVDGDLVPVDLALGWGEMSDWENIRRVKLAQRHRYYNWRVDDWFLPREVIETSSANMHFVPADAEVRSVLMKARRRDVVSFSGYLVQIRGAEKNWASSTTREDTGSYACEVVFIETFEILAL